ncbi:serine hydrolase domain-containing protein [Arthrobacter sp. B2a2-09]|uniref:serine hydrolase domain-containing protein n=1 Tax=Arthrobacter sp. B2a2-09 TaxID=2952822 RepID=UPI0022CDB111|nr:serine hydrolase domain-containing protein [Arthrobacter sp. B2a2-09]MCZ9883175.1 beta-lactamase family protein [Arthrobacter sp. B2a2-09]
MPREPLFIPIKDQMDAAMAHVGSLAPAPGSQAALMRNGELIWTGVHGLARVDQTVPVSDRTPFCLASFGKLVLAACTLYQVERGVICLDRPIAMYLGDDVPGADTVTVRMLLTHTAGYPDIYASPQMSVLFPPGPEEALYEAAASDPAVRNAYDPNQPFTWSMFAEALGSPVDPGRRWAYSNTGYLVLAQVLVQALGSDEQMERACSRLIHSAGGSHPMNDDLLTLRRSPRIAGLLAHGYQRLSDGSFHDTYAAWRPSGIPVDLFGLPFGDGLFAGTAIGAAQFLDGLFVRRTLLNSAFLEQMVSPTPQAMAGPAEPVRINSYGMGTFRTQVAGSVWQGHSGSYGGYTAMGASEVSAGVTLVAVANGLPPIGSTPSAGVVETPAGTVWNALAAVCADYFEAGP